MVAVPVFMVDAFTTTPFRGNPAAVCILESDAGKEWMSRVALELSQPATAFLFGRRLRWFTPSVELPLCGHGTLATAHVLSATGRVGQREPITFDTLGGPLTATVDADHVWLNFAAATVADAPVPASVLTALRLREAEWFVCNDNEFVVGLVDAEAVAEVRPNMAALRELPVTRTMVTAPGAYGVDFVSRVFVPALGLDEDYVTGSAHAVLGPLWARRLGRSELAAVQTSARPGELAVVVDGDRVRVGGQAVITARGELESLPVPG